MCNRSPRAVTLCLILCLLGWDATSGIRAEHSFTSPVVKCYSLERALEALLVNRSIYAMVVISYTDLE